MTVEPREDGPGTALPDSNDIAVIKVRTNHFVMDLLAVRAVVNDGHKLRLYTGGKKNRDHHTKRPEDVLSCFHSI